MSAVATSGDEPGRPVSAMRRELEEIKAAMGIVGPRVTHRHDSIGGAGEPTTLTHTHRIADGTLGHTHTVEYGPAYIEVRRSL